MDLSATPPTSRAQDAVPHFVERLEQWLSKRWVIVLINIVLLGLLAYSAAQWTWRLLTPPIPTDATYSVVRESAADFDVSALIATDLYGRAAIVESSGQNQEIPLSSLNLTLTGVFASPNGGIALISADGGPQIPFAIGQEILGGVTLHEIQADRVLIKRGQTTESLLLKDETPELADGSIMTGGSMPTPAARTGASGPSGVQPVGRNQFNISRQQMNQQLQKPDFLSQALMTPNAGGGFLVREIQPGSVYEKLGLRVGDVINHVNGQPVNNMQDVMRLYQQLSGNGTAQVSIQVRRAGKSETLQYNIR